MKEQIKKLFERISKWKFSIPIGEYRYTGHSTIYKSTTGTFKPSERAILVHRYLHRNMKNRCYKFYVKTKGYDHNDEYYINTPLCWSYGMVLSICHNNNHGYYGYLDINYACGTTGEWKEMTIDPWTDIVMEEVSVQEYSEVLDRFLIKELMTEK